MRYEYLPGANFQFNPSLEDETQIEEYIAKKWKGGEYRVTFSPPRNSGLTAFTYYFNVADIQEVVEEPPKENKDISSSPFTTINIPPSSDKTANIVIDMLRGVLADQTKRTEEITKSFMDIVKTKPNDGQPSSNALEGMMKMMLEFMSKTQPQPQQQINTMEMVSSIFSLAKQMTDIKQPQSSVAEQINFEAIKMLLEQANNSKQDPIELLRLGIDLARSGEIPSPNREEKRDNDGEDEGFSWQKALSKGLDKAIGSAADKFGEKVAEQAGSLLGGMPGLGGMGVRPSVALPAPKQIPQQQPRPARLIQRPQQSQPVQRQPQPAPVQTPQESVDINIPTPESLQNQIAMLVKDLESDKSSEQIADEILPNLHPMVRLQFKEPFDKTMESFLPMMPPDYQQTVRRNHARILEIYNIIQSKLK